MAEDQFISSFDGTKLYYNPEVTPDDKAVCIIVHGLCEHQGRYDYMAKRFHEAGIGTYRFDHRGHGKSEGECAYYTRWDEILDDTNVVVDRAIAENPDRPVFMFGHSMGGYCVALYGAKYPGKKLRGIICNGGLTEDKAGMLSALPDGLDPHTQLPNQLGDGVCSVAAVRERYVQDPLNRKTYSAGLGYALRDGIKWFSTNKQKFAYPVLLTHGQNDGIISFQDTYDLFAAISSEDPQMKIYGNCFHEVMNEWCRDEVINDYIHWMEYRM